MPHRGICLAPLVLAFIVAGAGSALLTAGDQKPAIPVITKPGAYKLHDGKLEVRVLEDTGKLDYEVKIAVGEASYSKQSKGTSTIKRENAVWAIYAESKSKVWIFWGDRLIRHEVVMEKGVPALETRQLAVDPGAAIAAMPKAMVEALPKDFVEKHKGKK